MYGAVNRTHSVLLHDSTERTNEVTVRLTPCFICMKRLVSLSHLLDTVCKSNMIIRLKWIIPLVHFSALLTVFWWERASSQGLALPCNGTVWFGSGCQYKCHCANNNCDNNGTCTGVSNCGSGWFGPACQYVDLVRNYSISGNNPAWLYDTTCNPNKSSQSVTVTLSDVFYFTWMRLHFSEPGTPQNNSIQVTTSIDNTIFTNCSKLYSLPVNDTVLDIHCVPGVQFNQLTVTGLWVGHLCSLYVSGGRNVALKQNTTQSSTLKDGNLWYTSDRAVDGNRDNVLLDRSCTHTNFTANKTESWTLKFLQSHHVNRYVIYNKENTQEFRLRHFVLEADLGNGTPAFMYNDTITANYTSIFYIPSKNPETEVSRVTISLINYLTLCEVEMYGDTQCERGYYGRECEHTCNCATQDNKCLVNTGGCPLGCAAGYHGEDCKEPCDLTFYGINCMQECSTNCSNHNCNSANGHCFACINGTQGLKCESDCEPTYYGDNCSLKCSGNCHKQLCNAISGICDFCKAGRTGQQCYDECKETYFGVNCAQNCSTNCQDQHCRNTDGVCVSCVSGRSGPFCDQDPESLPVGAIIGAVVGFVVLIILIVIGVIIWRKYKGKKADYRSENSMNSVDAITLDSTQISVKSAADKPPNYTPTKQTPPDDHSRVHLQADSKKKHGDYINASYINGYKKQKKYIASQVRDKPNLSPNNTYYNNQQPTADGTYYNISLELSDTSISAQDLNTFMSSHTKEYFQTQFTSIPANTLATTNVALSPQNQHKNRYKNISAYDHSRVHLQADSKKKHGDYINASYINGYKRQKKYIASQGPTKTILEDFVRMLWEQEVEVVVMLTNLIEEGKLKCEQYWPNDDQIDIGEITIKLTTTQIFADYTIRRLQLFKGHGAIKNLTHFHFTTWPDKNVPINAWGLVELEQRIEHVATDNPIVVHCSTGVGRTAIFIALQNALEEIEETDHMDFFTTVQKLRNDRINMIQTSEQYEFLHRETQIALVCKGTTVTSNNIQDRIQTLENMSATGESNLEKEFKSLCLVCYEKNSCNDGERISNNLNYSRQIVSRKMKTRLHNALSEDYSTPILESEILSMESCINTVYIPNFRGNNYHLLTQLPLHTTITDFWRLVIHCNVGLVVAFEMIIKNEDTTIGDYLLERDDDDKTTSFFNIKKQSLQSGPNLDVQRVVVTIDREQLSGETNVDFPQFDGEYRLSHIACKNRRFDPESLLELVRHIRSLSPVGERRILYMCRNGAKFSGLVCTMTLLLDRMDNDQHVSVPLVLGSVKAIRPQVVATLDEYRLLYKALNLYIERINAYSNVGTTR